MNSDIAQDALEPRPPQFPTRFAGWSRGRALAVLALVLAATGWCLWVALTQETVPVIEETPQAPGDAEFYRLVVARVHAGEAYYPAVENELNDWGYQPHSLFNW